MPAWAEEIEAALEEGILLHTLTNPVEIIQQKGTITGVKCTTMKLGEFDPSGRRSPVTGDETFVFQADQVILATGQTLDCASIFDGIKLETKGSDKIKCNPLTGQTSVPWIFSGGDSVSGPSSVIEAVAGGEIAAVGIDEFFTGEKHAFWRAHQKVDTFFDPDDEPAPFPRKDMALLSVARRKVNFDEVEQVWSEGEAVRQAKRCLRCDYGKC